MSQAIDGAASTARWQSYAVWAAVIAPVWLVLLLGCYWEPVVRDSWGHVWWHDKTDVSLYAFAKDTYLHNNPRAGQVIAWLLFTPGPWHVIVTPLVEFALFYLLATLVLGRWPSVRKTDDALVVATLVGMIAATCPLIGPMLFYRPYSGNYLYGLVLNLALLVPYRLALASPTSSPPVAPRPHHWLAPVLLVIGLLAGLSNEHTDPALVALTSLATGLAWRRGQLRPWMIAGLVGAIAGAALLYLAPGQNLRYEGLATQQSLLQRITARGADNLDIVTLLGRYLRPLLWWGLLVAACAIIARKRITRITWLLAATSLAITLTLLASPKQGGRLYLASVASACAAATSLLASQLQAVASRLAPPAQSPRNRPQLQTVVPGLVAWGLAAFFAIRIGAVLVSVYAAVGPEGHDRLAKIRSAPAGSTLTLPAFSRPRSRWFMGDDFVYEKWRRHVAEGWGLARIDLEGAGSEDSTTGSAATDED